RLLRGRHGRGRIGLLQVPTEDVVHRLLPGTGVAVILIRGGEVADPRVAHARPVTGRRKGGQVIAHGERKTARTGATPHRAAGTGSAGRWLAVGLIDGADDDVLRQHLQVIDVAAGAVERVPGPVEPRCQIGDVRLEQVAHVDQHAVAVLLAGLDVERLQ